MSRMSLFVPSHTQERLDAVPKLDGLVPVLLSDLDLIDGLENSWDNSLAESRLFLCETLVPTDAVVIGQFNSRAAKKYGLWDFSWHQLADRVNDTLSRADVAAAWRTDRGGPTADGTPDWASFSQWAHPGMIPLLYEMVEVTGVEFTRERPSLWANDFACRSELWLEFRSFFRKVFRHFHGKYGYDLPLPPINMRPRLKAAYFYERVATLFFSNPDYKVEQISFPPTDGSK